MAWPIGELTALAREVEIEVVYTSLHTRAHAHEGALLGTGALKELAETMHGATGDPARPALRPAPDLVLVDAALSPQQQRALSAALALEVVDRSELILRLFALRARTRVAKLTVEIARLSHALPRLREDDTKRGREGGGGRGERGHTQVALAKQRARARIAALTRELERAQRAGDVQRARRRDVRSVALVGYTNAGKSSWLNALTGKPTLIADRPFATLETTVRGVRWREEQGAPILISDTVGFVRALPHALVPSFRATLREASEADLLLCVADASDPNVLAQREVSEQTLAEIGAGETPRLWLLNKVDRAAPAQRARLAERVPEALFVSAWSAADVARVKSAIAAHLSRAAPA